MTSLLATALCKSYGHYPVLKGIRIEVRAGECYILLGPNGAGKTTLMKILATLMSPTSGRVEIAGHDVSTERSLAREQMFFVGHGSHLYDDLTVIENLQFSLGLRGSAPQPAEMKRALDRVGIGPFGTYKTRHLSAGMKKRLMLARALLVRPKVLLMDETYAALDEHGMAIANDCIREMTQNGMTVLMTSHHRAAAAEVAHRVGVLRYGILSEIAVSEMRGADALF